MPISVNYEPNRILWRRLPFPMWYGFAPNEEAYQEAMTKFGLKDHEYPTTDACCTSLTRSKNNDHACIITVHERFKRLTPGVTALIAHECVHVYQRTKESMKDQMTDTDENMAYLIQAVLLDMLLDFTWHRVTSLRKA